MKWVEIIRLRASERATSLSDLSLKPAEALGREGLLEVRVYRHAALQADLSVHLLWNSDAPGCAESDLGLRLAEAFRGLGLVDHSLWIEEEGHVRTICEDGGSDERSS